MGSTTAHQKIITEVRLNVITLTGQEEWKNVEMTGYVKVISKVKNSSLSNFSGQNNVKEQEPSEDGKNSKCYPVDPE
jgi:hypothetical protein